MESTFRSKPAKLQMFHDDVYCDSDSTISPSVSPEVFPESPSSIELSTIFPSSPTYTYGSNTKSAPRSVDLKLQVAQIPCLIEIVENDKDQKTVSNMELAVENVRRHYLSPTNEESWEGKDSLDLVAIGPNGTTVTTDFLVSLDWSSGSQVTRKLLTHLFDRETLASHTLTGKPSPAFRDRDTPAKRPLDALKVADIIHVVTTYTNSSAREVRMAITTKCADENKMMRNRIKRKKGEC